MDTPQQASLTNERATNDKALNINANVSLANENTISCCIFNRRRRVVDLDTLNEDEDAPIPPISPKSSQKEPNITEIEVPLEQ